MLCSVQAEYNLAVKCSKRSENRQYSGTQQYTSSVAVSSDRRVIVSRSQDKTVRQWDFQSGASSSVTNVLWNALRWAKTEMWLCRGLGTRQCDNGCSTRGTKWRTTHRTWSWCDVRCDKRRLKGNCSRVQGWDNSTLECSKWARNWQFSGQT